MPIEALYPSRRQPRIANPLFAREIRRRRRVAVAVGVCVLGGLVALDLLPASDGAMVEGRSAAVSAVASPAAPAPGAAPRAVRIIPL